MLCGVLEDVNYKIVASIALKEHTSTDSTYYIFNHHCNYAHKRPHFNNCQHCLDLLTRMKSNDSLPKEKRKLEEVAASDKELKKLRDSNKKMKGKDVDSKKLTKSLKRKIKRRDAKIEKLKKKVEDNLCPLSCKMHNSISS